MWTKNVRHLKDTNIYMHKNVLKIREGVAFKQPLTKNFSLWHSTDNCTKGHDAVQKAFLKSV